MVLGCAIYFAAAIHYQGLKKHLNDDGIDISSFQVNHLGHPSIERQLLLPVFHWLANPTHRMGRFAS